MTRPHRPVPRWVIVVGIPVMVLVAIAAVWLMLAFGLQGDQLDAIRTRGTLGVGLGGVVVLWLAVRRQRSTELDLAGATLVDLDYSHCRLRSATCEGARFPRTASGRTVSSPRG